MNLDSPTLTTPSRILSFFRRSRNAISEQMTVPVWFKRTTLIVDILAALGLYGVSSTFSILLYRSLSPQNLLWVYTGFALIFELSKIILWIEGIALKKPLLKALALTMTMMSFIASAISLTGEEEVRLTQTTIATNLLFLPEQQAKEPLDALDREVSILEARIAAGGPEYRTDAKETQARLDKLRTDRIPLADAYAKAVQDRLTKETLEPSKTDSNPFNSLATKYKLDPAKTRFIYTLCLTFLLEAGGLATSSAAVRTTLKAKESKKRPKYLYVNSGQLAHSYIEDSAYSLCGKAFALPKVANPSLPLCPTCLSSMLREDTDE